MSPQSSAETPPVDDTQQSTSIQVEETRDGYQITAETGYIYQLAPADESMRQFSNGIWRLSYEGQRIRTLNSRNLVSLTAYVDPDEVRHVVTPIPAASEESRFVGAAPERGRAQNSGEGVHDAEELEEVAGILSMEAVATIGGLIDPDHRWQVGGGEHVRLLEFSYTLGELQWLAVEDHLMRVKLDHPQRSSRWRRNEEKLQAVRERLRRDGWSAAQVTFIEENVGPGFHPELLRAAAETLS